MQNAWSQAIGAGPFFGSSFEFVIADGQIQQVTHDFDFSEFSPQVFDVFVAWLTDDLPRRRRRHVGLRQRQLQPDTPSRRPLRTTHHRVRLIAEQLRIRLSNEVGTRVQRGQTDRLEHEHDAHR